MLVMATNHADGPPPLGERQLIDAYLAGAGADADTLLARDDAAARKLLTDASLYATSKLTEIESRLHYLRKLHGEE